MTDDQYKKLMRRFTITWWLFGIALIILATLYFSQPGTQVHNFVGEKGDPGQTVIGPQGPPGASVVGEQGPAGADGKEKETVIHEKETVIERSTEPGPKGDSGEPGREIELQRNEETGDVEWRYNGDRFWQVLLPVCEVTDSCEAEGGPGAN